MREGPVIGKRFVFEKDRCVTREQGTVETGEKGRDSWHLLDGFQEVARKRWVHVTCDTSSI
jgi:hypothetical protein